ncbi:MAG: hypothetical protein V3T02_09465 [Alphaproteobacteria bacterium]
MGSGITNIVFAPALPLPVIAGLAAFAAVIAVLGLYKGARGMGWRCLALGALVLALLNPSLKSEQREPLNDIAVVVVDQSPSQEIGKRRTQSAAVLDHLRKELARHKDLEVRILRSGGGGDDAKGRTAPVESTRLFEALERTLADVPPQRLGGVIMITDGQVHDAPKSADKLPFTAPLHVFLAGARNARDRRLVVEQVPSFGIVGNRLEMTVRVVDLPAQPNQPPVRLTIRRDGGKPRTIDVPTGVEQSIDILVDHGGANVYELEVEPRAGELTLDNNRAAVIVNGVRDRLRVLLVSGVPHAGERVWRNLLKADPSVDLVHFTILRPPEKQDGTPVRELSLIAFPTRELFEEKLNDFDLIIFDRYHRRGVLPRIYLQNIVRYVRKGGAVLEAGGPAFATALGLYRTPLGEILPGAPTGQVIERGFRPQVTKLGHRHPVAADLPGSRSPIATPAGARTPKWGRWFRLIEADTQRGMVLMSGINNRPVLILDRIGEGRIAQLLTDHIWLWARGFEGGGPQAELLRRLAHWLMKEPELEENDLRATVQGSELTIVRRSLKPEEVTVTIRAPSGKERTATLKEIQPGRATAAIAIGESGLYRISDGKRVVHAAAGTLNPPEFADVRASAEHLGPLAGARSGGVIWIKQAMDRRALPAIRRTRAGRDSHGRGWIGIRANGDYIVKGVHELPLLPGILLLLLGLGGLMAAWRREGE